MSIFFNNNLSFHAPSVPSFISLTPGIGFGLIEKVKITTVDDKVVIPDAPTNFFTSNKKFLGWTDDPSNPNVVKFIPGEEKEIDTNKVLIAVWSEKNYNRISYTYCDDENNREILLEEGLSHTIIDTVPVKVGYVFLGWSLDPQNVDKLYNAGETIEIPPLNYGISLFGIYAESYSEEPPYKIILKPGYGTGEDKIVYTDSAGNFTLPEEMPEGWGFPENMEHPGLVGWSTELSFPTTSKYVNGDCGDVVAIPHDYILYANYLEEEKFCTIYCHPYDAHSMKSLEGYPCQEGYSPARSHSMSVPYGQLCYVPNQIWIFDGYEYWGWLVDGSEDEMPKKEGDFGPLLGDIHLYGCYVPE